MFRFEIDFLGRKLVFAVISSVLLVIAIATLAVRGLSFGIEFQGGTVINITGGVPLEISKVRKAFEDAGFREPVVQSTEDGGFIVRSTESDPDEANRAFGDVAVALGLDRAAGTVTTIGPGWGRSVTNAALLALMLSVLAILLYISLRFEYKMSITAVIALIHDIIIVLGIYSLSGRDVTPNTIAALLTIMGYSLYDTVVVFHRMKENSANLVKSTFSSMANNSINQVLMRTINTSLTSLIPVVVLLFFGGETLKDFAFALTLGLLIGTYSSIGVASPIYVLWKEREPKFRALAKKYAQSS